MATRDASVINTVVWHTAGAVAKDGTVIHQTPEVIDTFHRAKGWLGHGYQRHVMPDGSIFEMRSDTMVPACVELFNETILGILFTGHGDYEPLTPEQWEAGIRLSVGWCRRYGIEPARVVGHNECDELPDYPADAPRIHKTCPGKLVPMADARAQIAERLERSTLPAPPPAAPGVPELLRRLHGIGAELREVSAELEARCGTQAGEVIGHGGNGTFLANMQGGRAFIAGGGGLGGTGAQ